ncbi:hypothetical protein ACFX4N_24310 [Priestia sp. YIM B13551]|uniref:hypothetical protein n=1 Tax=Priestia sp. YIM B13551 TaxID=3366306 RepID=UPI0036706ABD
MSSVDLGWFLISQTIYGIGSYAIMSALFQLRFRLYFPVVLVITILNSIINYLVYFNKEADLGYIVPIIAMVIAFLYLAAVVEIPIIWSFVVTITGSVIVPLVVQLGILSCSFGFFMPSALKEHIWRNYALDITSGLIFVLVTWILHTLGWGFKFDFEKIRLKREKWLVITIATCSVFCFPAAIVFTHINNVTLSLTFLSISSILVFLFLLGYATKKERDEIKYLKPIMEVEKHD